jgi:cob(I)alamin adenosyltransferase
MVKLDRITTRGGDRGETSLGDGARVSKASLRIEAIGAVDETNAAIGLLRLHTTDDADQKLARIQNDLFDAGADLAIPQSDQPRIAALRIAPAQLSRLEEEIAAMNAGLPPLTGFVLPGGGVAAAHAHLARTLARRAERAVTALGAVEPLNADLIRYLNRLSDHLFVLSRVLHQGAEHLWRPPPKPTA